MQDNHAIFVASRFRDGGVEKRINNLTYALITSDINCTFIIGEKIKVGAHESIPTKTNLIEVDKKSLSSSLTSYINSLKGKNIAVLTFRTADYSWVINACKRMTLMKPKVFLVSGAFISQRLQYKGTNIFKAWKNRRRMAKAWSQADGIITISPEIAKDWISTGYISKDRIHAPPPPVVSPEVEELSLEKIHHPWIDSKQAPVVLGVGRLSPSKRFDMLIRSVALIRQQQQVKLIILGQGKDENCLKRLVQDLGLENDIDFPGFVTNPYAWMRASDVLVLPSKIEPFGLVLIESLFVGTPFVASASPPGPRSIKNATNQGILVDNETPEGFAKAIQEVINTTYHKKTLKNSVYRFRFSNSAKKYIEIIF